MAVRIKSRKADPKHIKNPTTRKLVTEYLKRARSFNHGYLRGLLQVERRHKSTDADVIERILENLKHEDRLKETRVLPSGVVDLEPPA
jgi:hypothetical protein